ncbi:MAG: dihydrofolate reductase [Ignavibacteria bacterium]|nr:dihydrofolate reductase [Ignavibacteria bacterium]MBT8381914.1 dihydrofolate reductase [Ignavibacteria bacterium]MBT8390597.1 dihydrofolate reductase [Ignavibacteria bacterium]NNL22384.1 dihydrofolate reductase [Ignavibacteriaceae bacterium]
MRIILISAIAKNGVIGRKNGEMPWHIKEEFQHFKNTTMGSALIMGRKSFESLGKPLKGRENIIVTRNYNYSVSFDDVKIFYSLDESIEYCENKNYEKIFIIGGGEIYKQGIPKADELILSHLKFDAEGEIKFPKINSSDWKVVSTEERDQFEIVKYVRSDE